MHMARRNTVPITIYLEPDEFERMERLRKERRRVGRSAWGAEAMLEKIAREEKKLQPTQDAPVGASA